MPGTQLCVRCGASLEIALATLNVYPRRANRWWKAIRQWLPIRRAYYCSRDAVAAARPRSILAELVRPVQIDRLTPGLVMRMVLPGWAHAYLGNRVRGAVFALAYWPCLLYALVTLGSSNGAIALGLAFAVHAASLVDLLTSSEDGLLRRIVTVPIVVTVLLAACYWGMGAVVSQFALARQIVLVASPFIPGDVVLVNQLAFVSSPPQPGDVVLYRIPDRRRGFRMAGIGHQRRMMNIQGERIDRVIAGPGSTVRWEDGKLSVNGQPTEIRPLNSDRLPPFLAINISSDHYAILLTTDTLLDASGPSAAWQFVCSVPADHIVGRVYLRSYPLSRWSWIR